MKKQGAFPQGTQRIGRIARIAEIEELQAPNAFVLAPAPAATPSATEQNMSMVEGTMPIAPITDAEIASAIVNTEAPYIARPTKRFANAYAQPEPEPLAGERRIQTIA